jgi:cytochrome d ubiquinol oxidase subunit I
VSQDWNPIWDLSHNAYDIHATLGIIGALVAWVLAYSIWRRPKWLSFLGLDNPTEKTIPLAAAFLFGWLQLIAWEAGWVAAETGRQPWVIWGPMVQTASGLYAIQAGLATADAFNNSPEVLPIGITIMIVLAVAVAGTVYMLKKLFSARRIADDVSASLPLLSGSAGVMATQTSKDLSIGNDKIINKER